MAFISANHFVVSGGGIDGVVDTASLTGAGTASLTVDGRELRDPSIDHTFEGLVVKGIYEEAPDAYVISASITIPEVNLDSAAATCTGAGFAVLTRQLTSIGGPRLVSGSLHLFDLRPLAVTASVIQSARSASAE